MKNLISLLSSIILVSTFCSSFSHAGSCSIGGITEKNMRLSTYLHSQAATSFKVKCDRAYNIRFSSMNLVNSNGSSFVRNGPVKLSTFMQIDGANKSEWNVLLSPRNPFNNKFSVIVELMEKPNIRTPAGTYSDEIYIELFF